MRQTHYRIGELADLSGVPVKTIRYYSDIGVLPPSALLSSGHRLYTDTDRARLELIRTLRGVGFGLPTITELLAQDAPAEAAMKLQLEALEVQQRTLRRQQSLLRAALRRGPDAALAYLGRAQALVGLDAHERQAFVSRQLEHGFDGVPAHEDWKARLLEPVLNLPDELSDAQFEAWLELADLISDEAFLERLRVIGQGFWGALPPDFDFEAWNKNQQTILKVAMQALEQQQLVSDAASQRLIGRLVALYARIRDDLSDPAALLDHLERGEEPRAERFWELVGVLHGWHRMPPLAAAMRWLMDGLRVRIARKAGKRIKKHRV